MTTKIKYENAWPKKDLEKISNCPVCGSPQRILIHQRLKDKIFFIAPGEWVLFRCEECGSGYLDPRPTSSSICRAYSSYFTHSVSEPIDLEKLSWLQCVKRKIANGYRNQRFGLQTVPAYTLGNIAMKIFAGQRGILEAERRHLPKLNAKKRLLDFGCGNGRFLKLASEMQWESVGIDFDPKAVQNAQEYGLKVFQGGVELLNDELGSFDCITLSHVIEHMHDPLCLLTKCFELLKPGGWLWLETPNFDASGYHFYGCNWRGLEPPRHLVLFTPKSLQNALEKIGFQHIEDQLYRPLCREIYSASEKIINGMDPWGKKTLTFIGLLRVLKAELIARINPASREFITIKVWKK